MDSDEPLPSDQRPLFLVNVYIIHTVQFLNKFSSICERKLAEVHRRLLRIETKLALLEAKLKSIGGVENMVGTSCLNVSQELSRSSSDGMSENDTNVMVSSSGLPLSSSTMVVEQPTDSDVSSSRTEQQPMSMVDRTAVKLQMSVEGHDPSLLDKLDARSPSG